jgi:hypothetical protein
VLLVVENVSLARDHWLRKQAAAQPRVPTMKVVAR